MAASTSPIPEPANPVAVASDTVVAGPPIPALDRIKLFSSSEWEDFVLEWADSLRGKYASVERCGGAGDMGRDVVAIVEEAGDTWDNYQCKHYAHALRPTDIWVELGKLVYYTHKGEFTYPRAYAFVAPQGAGTKLSNLLRKSLKQGLKDNWASYCRSEITSTATVELEGDLLTRLDALDFGIFSATPALKIIDAHAKTRWHVARFGGGHQDRRGWRDDQVAARLVAASRLSAAGSQKALWLAPDLRDLVRPASSQVRSRGAVRHEPRWQPDRRPRRESVMLSLQNSKARNA